jgi:DnaJ-class molecular chaperone
MTKRETRGAYQRPPAARSSSKPEELSVLNAPHYYGVLGVHRQSEPPEIRRAWLALAKVHHPDRGGNEQVMMRINRAYETLGDAFLKRAYDKSNSLVMNECGSCRGEGCRWKTQGFKHRTSLRCDDCQGAGYLSRLNIRRRGS